MNKYLEHQSDRIEATLAQHKMPTRVTGGHVYPRWIRFDLQPEAGARTGGLRDMGPAFTLALAVPSVRVSRQNGGLALDIPRTDPQPVRLLPLQHKLDKADEIPLGTAVIGMAESSRPLLMRLPSSTVRHVLITGNAGTGKSALLRAIVTSLALRHGPGQMSFVLIDPTQRTFGPLVGLRRPTPDVVRLMQDRERDGWADLVVLAVDEADLAALLPIVQRGHEVGIHVVAVARHPDDEALAFFPVRLATARNGDGQFVATANGKATRFDAAHVTAREVAEVVCRRIVIHGNGT